MKNRFKKPIDGPSGWRKKRPPTGEIRDLSELAETLSVGVQRDCLLLALTGQWIESCTDCEEYSKGLNYDQLHSAANLAGDAGFAGEEDYFPVLAKQFSPIESLRALCEMVEKHHCRCSKPIH